MYYVKGRSSRRLQKKFKELSKRYWANICEQISYGLRSTGNVSEEMVQ